MPNPDRSGNNRSGKGRSGKDRLLGVLGLCARAGRLIYGVPLVCDALRAARPGKVPLLVLEAADTSPATHKRITDRCAFYATETVQIPVSVTELSHAVGRDGALAAVAVTDPGFCRALAPALRCCIQAQPPETEPPNSV